MHSIEFIHALPIGPVIQNVWPDDYRQPLYWIAKKHFSLDGMPDYADITMSADRHYELFINGQLAARNRNFFNGDKYLYAQKWDSEILSLLKPGANTIEVVIRSDPWNNKNYRCFRPMLILEANIICGSSNFQIGTNDKWQVAEITNWRQQIAMGANRTIHFESILLPPATKAMLSGFSSDLNFSAPCVLNCDSLPDIYMWQDSPKRIDEIVPQTTIACGNYELAKSALVFDIGSTSNADSENSAMTISAAFEDDGEHKLQLASSALTLHQIELNGKMFFENRDAPDRYQMQLSDYLAPAGESVTQKGLNNLRITVFRGQQGWRPLRLAAKGFPNLMEPAGWKCEDGKPVTSTAEHLELSEQIGAKFTGGHDKFMLLDFGKVTTGRIRLKIHAASGGRIYIAYGFSHQSAAVDCHKMLRRAVDVLEVPCGESIYESFDVRTFRYLDVLFENFSGPVEISDIQSNEPVFFDEKNSSLITSDETVNTIWQAARRTAQLCGNELYVDNPEREHAQWLDALLGVSSAGYYAFAEQRKTAKILDEFIMAQQPDGQLPGYAPGKWFPRKPLQCHMALFCIVSHRHFMHSGDEALAGRTLDAMLKIIEHWRRHANSNELITDIHTVFVDWGSHIYSYDCGCKGPIGALTALNAYYLGALKAAAEMAKFLRRDNDAVELNQLADSVQHSITLRMYDSAIGLFRDGTGNELAEKNISQTANALAVLFGAAPKGHEKAVIMRAFGPEKPENIIPANALFSEHAGCAMFESGCDGLAVNWLKNGFGKMLQEGPGTFWETWQPHASMCQATGASPVYLLGRYLAGIYPVEPGYKTVGLDPHPAGVEGLNARLATPVGNIGVVWRHKGDLLDCSLTLPEALHGRPVLKPDWVNLHVTCDK